MKKLVFGIALIALASAFAAAPSPEARAKALEAARARMAENAMKKGGILEMPNSLKGNVTFIDTQSKASLETAMNGIIGKFTEHLRINVRYIREKADDPAALRRKCGASFAIVFVDDATAPATLIAPEDRWAVVNVARYGKALKSIDERKDVYNARCAKAGLKAFMLLCGGGGSRFPGHVGAATKVEDLDLAHDQIPYDCQEAIRNYLKACGVTPLLRTSYRRACEEGWAPQPTNEYQKAVWDKVHKAPTAPIVIKPEPAKKK